MKKVCPICSKNKANRLCKIRNNIVICSLCCVAIRNEDCMGCSYYEDAQRYGAAKEKQKKQKEQTPHFIKRIAPEVDAEVNNALELAERGRLSEGKEILTKLLVQNSDLDSVHFGIGTICALQKNHDEALVHFDKAVKIFPYHVEAWFNKGMIYKIKLEIDKMVECFRKVVKFGDSNDSYVVEAKKMIDDITKQIRDTSNITLDDFLIAGKKFKEGFDYMNKKEWKKAINKFKEVISIDYEHVQSYGNMGICYAFIGEKQKALEALNKAIELDPEYMPAISNKNLISSMSEGEKSSEMKLHSTEYYKEIAIQKK